MRGVFIIIFSVVCIGNGLFFSWQVGVELWRVAQRNHERQQQYDIAEAKLRDCANSLSEELGKKDAIKDSNAGDNRLYALVLTYQESWHFEVPGLEHSTFSEGSPADRVTGVIPPSGKRRTFLVVSSPKGTIWTDPWSRATDEKGRPPPHATRCDIASRAYVSGHNAVIIQRAISGS